MSIDTKGLESDATAFSNTANGQNLALFSIAISLKRIADTLDGTAAGVGVTQTIFAGIRE